MKIMNEYTYQHLIKNKRHSISSLIAITIATTLLCSLCIYGYTLWKVRVQAVISAEGNWHGELWSNIRGDQLKYVTENPNVETTLVKGNWITAKIDNCKRQYLLLRNADQNYWKDMSEKNTLMDGKIPEKSGEIALTKSFFDDNPTYKIGDTITLPVGRRMLGASEVPVQAVKKEGESFEKLAEETYTLVGKLDVTTISAYPGYSAIGYLDRQSIKPDDGLTVYMRLENPRKIYKVLPQIAQAVGFEKDEYGQYMIRYNTSLLRLYGINGDKVEPTAIIIPTALIMIVMLVMGAFVLIIYNAFSLSANARIKQLGILKSLGATPRQIKYSVIYEAMLLSVLPIPIGILLGYLFSKSMVSLVNTILSNMENYTSIDVKFSWVVVALSVLISLVTVLISAYIPARKVGKMFPIETIQRNIQSTKMKKEKAYPIINKMFAIEGELAMVTFAAYKKSFRTAVISLSMCFLMLAGFVCTIQIVNYSNELNRQTNHYDLNLRLNISEMPSDKMIDQIIHNEAIVEHAFVRTTASTTYVTAQQESKEFASVGGFAAVDSKRFNVVKQQGSYRIASNILGLDDLTFENYCKQIGANALDYYNNGTRGILVNKTYEDINDIKRNKTTIPMLDTQIEDEFVLNEKTRDDMKTEHQFKMKTAYITDTLPEIDLNFNKYGIVFVVPMQTYENIVSEFMPERAVAYQKLSLLLLVGDQKSSEVKQTIEKICGQYLGTDDFYIWSELESKNARALVQQALEVVLKGVSLLLGFIGVSNAFSTISNNLKLRRREIAMLRSVGLTSDGLNKMLLLEGLFFGLKPIAVSIPFLFLICWLMLWVTNISWLDFLPNFPLAQIMLYAIIIVGTIWIAYAASSVQVSRNNIVEAIKDETI
jgi:putative ABC transport system permease protein